MSNEAWRAAERAFKAFRPRTGRSGRGHRHRRLGLPLAAIVALAMALYAYFNAESLWVHRVVDGDTIEVWTVKGRERARLVDIDAPEMSQPWGPEAKAALEKLVSGKKIKLETVGRDKYGRLLARLWIDGVCVNRSLVASGDAWSWERAFASEEAAARRQRLGLWGTATSPIPPWAWRKQKDGRDMSRDGYR